MGKVRDRGRRSDFCFGDGMGGEQGTHCGLRVFGDALVEKWFGCEVSECKETRERAGKMVWGQCVGDPFTTRC